MQIGKKILISIICFVYLVSYVVHDFIISGARAESTINSTNIVAIFVDKDIYNQLNSDLNRYTTQYIQKRISHTKATVFPINTDTFKAKDITKILENIYFDGEQNKTSKLIGTILIGDVPLPVVKQDNFVFPSIYPYVDFEEQQYIYNAESEFFEYSANPNGQAEIRHGIVNFDNDINAYTNYFNKLRTYANDPGNFVDAKIWYDDFSALKRYFTPDNLQYYVNKHIFAEDAAYQRFSKLFMDILQGKRNQNIASLGSDLSNGITSNLSNPSEYSTPETAAYGQALANYGNGIKDMFDANSGILTNSADVPTYTLLLKKIIGEFLKGYDTLYGNIYSETMRDNILAGGRWTINDLDNHIFRTVAKDDVMFRDAPKQKLSPTLQDFNQQLENRLNDQIEQEKYHLYIPIPLRYIEEDKSSQVLAICELQSKTYDMYLFGKKASTINSIMDTTIYKGTYQNLNTINNISVPYTGQSVGGSFNIFSQQVQANRGYNYTNTQNEIDLWSGTRIQGIYEEVCQGGLNVFGLCFFGTRQYDPSSGETCKEYNNNNGNTIYDDDQKELPLDFAMRLRGGASPINLIPNPSNANDQVLNVPNNFAYYKHALQPIYDIAGSKRISQITGYNDAQTPAKFGSMIQTRDHSGNIDYPRCLVDLDGDVNDRAINMNNLPFAPKYTKNYNQVDYFYAFNQAVGGGSVRYATPGAIYMHKQQGSCVFTPIPVPIVTNNNYLKRIWTYKTIDSRYYHTSPTPDQVNNMNITTQDRPIDNIRYVSFVGLDGQTVELPYPNLYATPVYNGTGAILTLKSPSEIEQSIKDFLISYVQGYNQKLQTTLAGRMNYYNTNPGAFNLLAQQNSLATPNRTYNPIPETLFVDTLGADTIKQIAEILYYQNMPWQAKKSETLISDEITNLQENVDINQKISYVMDQYLREDNQQGALQTPGYVEKGYEVAYINDDSIHTIANETVPLFVKNIQNAQTNFYANKKPNASKEYDSNDPFLDAEDKERKECNYDPMSPVPLVKWPAAVVCWAKQLVKKPFNFSITFPNTDLTDFGGNIRDQWSSQFDQYAQGFKDYGKQRATSVQIEQQNEATINNLPASQQQSLQDIMQYTITETNVGSRYIDPDEPQDKSINILSTKNVGSLRITISATGDNCLIVTDESNNLCDDAVVLTRNFFTNPIELPVVLGNPSYPSSTKAGLTTLTFKICPAANTTTCINKTVNVNTLPAALDSMEIIAPNIVIRGDTVPVLISAVDRFSNRLGLGLESFIVGASSGILYDGNTRGTGLVFNDFTKAQFSYTAPANAVHNTPLSVIVRAVDTGANTNFAAKEIIVKQPVAQIQYNNTPATQITYQLPNSFSAIKSTDIYGLEQVTLSAVPKITVGLKDLEGINLSTYIQISSSNNLLQPSSAVSTQVDVGNNNIVNQTILRPQNSFFVDNGTVTVYLEPTYTAGDDTLIITIPGLDTIEIPVVVSPAAPNKVAIDALPEFAQPGQTFQTTIRLYDIWDNPITTTTEVELGGFGSVTVNGQDSTTINITGGQQSITIDTIQPGGLSYIYAFIRNIGINNQLPAYARLAVQKEIVPETGLNVMYLNMFGNDRGNQWGYFSDINKSYINDRIENSDKLLTTTTQLINPDKLKEISVLVTPSLKVKNFAGQNISVNAVPGQGLFIAIAQDANIRIGESNTFGIQLINNIENVNVSSINQSTIVYIPETSDSFITSNTVQGNSILINQTEVFNTNTLLSLVDISLSTEQLQGHPIWEVTYNNRLVGRMIIKRTDQTILTQAASRTNIQDTANIAMRIVFAEGSTNGEKGIALTKTNSFFNNDISYDSIESSNDETIGVGFRGSFKNISNFAAGQYVGEATKPFSSSFLINIGDPLVQRIDKNKVAQHTLFDAGIGETVYSNPGKTIFKTLPFDFNNDGLDDLLIAHTDGSIKLLKNYGGSDGYKDVQNIMLIADAIKDIYVGDVDNNNYEDIIIRTNNNQLRVYTNNQGIFDVDGKMVCLDIPLGPDSLEGVTQLFIEDMDLDGNIDIVTNDIEGSIKIFYGGSTSNGSNYVSNLGYGCDPGRETRQANKVKLVKQFGIQLDETVNILDGSLVHWNGLAMPPQDDPNNPLGPEVSDLGGNNIDVALQSLATLYENEAIDSDTFQTNMSALMQSQGPLNALQNFDINSLVQAGGYQLLRYTPNPFSVNPSYETLSTNNIAYVSLGYLTGNDPVSVYKTYKDVNGGMLLANDEVIITVHIEGRQNTKVTFADQILGPWIIEKNGEDEIPSFDDSNLPNNTEIIWNTENDDYVYMLDNISVLSGQTITVNYRVKYKGGTPMRIDVKNVKDSNYVDSYPDIVVKPQDSCAKFLWTFFNANSNTQNYRSYNEEFTNLREEINDYYADLQTNADDNVSEVTDVVGDVGNGMQSSLVQGIVDQGWNPDSMFQNINNGNPINLDLNLNMTFLDDALGNVMDGLQNALDGLCGGFKIGGGSPCIQPPIPFNMAFLSPGTFNIFGCTLFEDKGLPLFFFPGTVYIMGAPIPMPYGLTTPGVDSFYWAPGGTIPSQIRIYVSPTLTAQLGFAICLGPQVAGNSIPPLFKDLGGNCITFSLAIPCNKPQPTTGPNEVYTAQLDPWWNEAADGGTCTQPTISYTQSNNNGTTSKFSSSPFKLMAQSPLSPAPSPIIPANTYGFGAIGIDTQPTFVDTSLPGFDDPDNIVLKAGSKIKLKIQGGSAKGLIKCIIQDWMDRQIKYIINNISQMTVGIYFPDVDSLFDGIESLNADRLEQLFAQGASTEPLNSAKNDATGLKKLSNRAQNNMVQQGQLANASAEISNPFELVAQMFEEVDLVNISTKDVIIPIPFIYAEDVIRYSSYLQSWLDTNLEIWEEWRNVVKSTLGICSDKTLSDDRNPKDEINYAINHVKQKTTQIRNGNLSPAEKAAELKKLDACNAFTVDVQLFVSINESIQTLVRGIKQNLKVLEQYQQFPLQLYEWMHIADRYLSELSGFISNFFGKIAYWIGTNAKRFSQYVDAIVTLIGVIKTRQVLIDFSVNRSQSCGSCSNDTYDFYSCSLSFLCPQLPILPIPPFKLPNIYLDMSRINLGLQILLPTFKFVPTTIPLPKIPNFPSPPRFDINIDLNLGRFAIPDVPILPAPPQLPELPSLVPQVELDLPVLPPAPKIPAIAPAIKATITAAEFIGKVMCIIKGKGVGLVGESGVKTKIEQMTQRSRNVPFFDYLDVNKLIPGFQDPPLQGFDYQIDSVVNLQFNFNGIYDVVNSMVNLVGDTVKKDIQSLNIPSVEESINEATEFLNQDAVTDTIQDVESGNPQGIIDQFNRNDIDIPEVDYVVAQKELLAGMQLLEEQVLTSTQAANVASIKTMLTQDNAVQGNIDAITAIEEEVQSIVSDKQKEVQQLKDRIYNDYDGFLTDLESDGIALVGDTQQTNTFKTSILSIHKDTESLLRNTDHPLLSYLNIQDGLAQGYKNALVNNSPESLNMHPTTYQKQQQYFDQVDGVIQAGKQLLAGNVSYNVGSRSTIKTQKSNNVQTSSRPLIASIPQTQTNISFNGPTLSQGNNGQTCTNCGTPNTATSDLSQYVQGVFVEGNNGKMINIIQDIPHAQQIGNNYFVYDVNGDNDDDVVLWDTESVYIKYANQQPINPSNETFYNGYYASPTLQSPSDILNKVNTKGYININGLKLKIYDKHWEVKNFRLHGQTFDDISFSWTSSEGLGDLPDGYIVKLNHRIDTYHDKNAPLSFISQAAIEKVYVLVLPEDTVIENNDRIILPDQNNAQSINNSLGDEIVYIRYFDPNTEDITLVLNDLSRKWKYAAVATLYDKGNNTVSIYETASPWSNQVVLGMQLLSDTIGPEPEIDFVRNATNTIISSGTDHMGYVSTDYSIDIQRTDNVAVSGNWIEDDQGNIIANYSGDTATISGLFFTGSTTKIYTIGAVDYNDNFTRTPITIQIDIPTIQIDAVNRTGANSGSIIASMNTDIDSGLVGFERMRSNIRQTLTGTQNNNPISLFPVGVGQTVVTGSLFSLDDGISLYNPAGTAIGYINPLNGEITIDPAYTNDYSIRGDFVSHVPMIKVVDNAIGQQLFQIYYAPNTLYGNNPIQILDPSISQEQLGSIFDAFAGGQCLKQNNDCLAYVSPTGNIYIPTPYHTSLHAEVIFNQDHITYIIHNAQGTPLVSISVVIQPLIN